MVLLLPCSLCIQHMTTWQSDQHALQMMACSAANKYKCTIMISL